MKRNTYNVDEELKTRFNLRHLLRILRYALPYKAAFITAFASRLFLKAVRIFLRKSDDTIIRNGTHANKISESGMFIDIRYENEIITVTEVIRTFSGPW